MNSVDQQNDSSLMFGEILVKRAFCKQEDIEQGLEVQERVGGRIGGILLNLGAITEEQLLGTLSLQFDIPLFRHTKHSLKPLFPEGVKVSFLRHFKLCTMTTVENESWLVVSNPLALEAIGRVELSLGKELPLLLGSEAEVEDLLNSLEHETGELTQDNANLVFDDEIEKLKELASEAPVIKLVNRVVSLAVESRASDIHFELFKVKPRVRIRIDGILKEIERIPTSQQLAVIARLKLISGMNIAENRLPQDGRISLRIAGKEIDIRASSAPTSFGESFVLRILGKEDISYSLDSLGFYPDHLQLVRELVTRSNGILLTTGPTGSGKTTTLYSVLSELNSEQTKIITVEDPVEYELEGVNQIHVQEKINYTFANALRSILRQDPDIIMIGEIRDKETAEIAIQSSLTGHLVLSTLHTNNALSSITRLMDMGIETFLLKAAISGLMAQRLVRKICNHCCEEFDSYDILNKKYNIDELISCYPGDIHVSPKKAVGCPDCNHTGYRGRLVIAEIAPFDESMREALDEGKWSENLGKYNHRTMMEDGLLKFAEGRTTIDEIMQAIG